MTDTPIPEMVERVARVIWLSNATEIGRAHGALMCPWHDLPPSVQIPYLNCARAAIEEMRVPAAHMNGTMRGSDVEVCWSTMIDQALGKVGGSDEPLEGAK